jgi:hypothetical protein
MKRSVLINILLWAIGVGVYGDNLPTGWTIISSSNTITTTLYAVSGSNGLTIQNTSTYIINGDLNLNAAGNDFSINVNNGSTLIIKGTLISTSTSYTIYITVNSGGTLLVNNGVSVSNSVNIQNNGSSTITGNVSVAGSGASITVNGSSNLLIDGNLTVGTAASVMVNGSLTVKGDMTGGTGSWLTNNGGATTNIYGHLTGFSVTGTGINTNLPVELTSFIVYEKQDNVYLTWQTATEENNDYFTVERSISGIEFEPVLTVAGAGNSSSVINYAATDRNPLPGTSYYRLKQTDYNGDYAYSQIIAVHSKSNSPYTMLDLIAYQAPYNNSNITFNLLGVETGNLITVTILAVNGQVVYNDKMIIQNQEINIPVQLNKGFYILSVQAKNATVSKKIVVE